MLSKTVQAISRSTNEIFSEGVERVRGLTLLEVRDLLRFARRRLREEMLPQVAGSLTFTTTLALVPLADDRTGHFYHVSDLRSAPHGAWKRISPRP